MVLEMVDTPSLTQKDKVLKLLTPTKYRKTPSLTQEEARILGIKSLSSRISELRDEGWPIQSQTFIRDNKTLVRYVLLA